MMMEELIKARNELAHLVYESIGISVVTTDIDRAFAALDIAIAKSGERDSNPRPLGPKPSALPD